MKEFDSEYKVNPKTALKDFIANQKTKIIKKLLNF